jgi:integrase
VPLKVVRRPDTNTLWIMGTVRPPGATEGVRIRQRAGTTDGRLAREAATALEASILRDAWHGKRSGSRTLAEAVDSYLSHAPRSTRTQALLKRIMEHFGDVGLAAITQESVDKARAAILRPNAAPATVRRNLVVPLRAVLLHASRRDWCTVPRFDVPPEPRGRITFMLPEQVDKLIAASAPHLRGLLRFLACTGCRVSEALGLDWRDVDLAAGRAILWEGETKGGNRRIVALPPAAIAMLEALPARAGRVFLDHHGKPYRDSGTYGGQIKSAWRTACRKAGIVGFTPHHLRHTWASWHYLLHRDLLRLKADGGWASTLLVERYAHIMPSGHEKDILGLWGIV